MENFNTRIQELFDIADQKLAERTKRSEIENNKIKEKKERNRIEKERKEKEATEKYAKAIMKLMIDLLTNPQGYFDKIESDELFIKNPNLGRLSTGLSSYVYPSIKSPNWYKITDHGLEIDLNYSKTQEGEKNGNGFYDENIRFDYLKSILRKNNIEFSRDYIKSDIRKDLENSELNIFHIVLYRPEVKDMNKQDNCQKTYHI